MHSSHPHKEHATNHSGGLVLRHPTPDECVKIWTATSSSWADSLPLSIYLEESKFLTTIPLAKDDNMTTWILVNEKQLPDQREIFCSCETFRKQSLTSDAHGNVTQNVVHGIASVFCPPEYRRRGYATRMMKELASVLPTWRLESGRQCVGSILYSDIGKSFYANLGWHPNPTNRHIEFRPEISETMTTPILEGELHDLCKRDEVLIRRLIAVPSEGVQKRVTIIPDLEHMLWHIRKEDFATDYLFSKIPHAKGAIIGKPGSQVWAIWVRRYYDHPNAASHENVLYILRLVVERDETATRLPLDATKVRIDKYDEQLGYLKAVLRAAQAEAALWKLDYVSLWDPTPLVQKMITESGVEHAEVDREEESIASGMWFDSEGRTDEAPLWVNNEYYTWL